MPNNKKKTYESLRYRIITHDLKPGTMINEKELMEHYEIGRTPLRDVLTLLERDGLIDRYPRSGTLVAPMHIHLLRQIIEIRLELDPLAARLAAERIDKAQIQRIKELAELVKNLLEERNNDQELVLGRYEFEFHHLVYEASKNKKLNEILNELHGISARFWHYFVTGKASATEQIQDVQMMAEALEAGDGDRAADIMRGHLLRFIEKIKGNLVEVGLK